METVREEKHKEEEEDEEEEVCVCNRPQIKSIISCVRW